MAGCMFIGLGTANVDSPLLVVAATVLLCGVFGPSPVLGVQGRAGVGGLYEPGVDGFVTDIGDAILLSTDFSRLGGGADEEAHELASASSCFTSCLIDDTGFHEAPESIVTSSTSVL